MYCVFSIQVLVAEHEEIKHVEPKKSYDGKLEKVDDCMEKVQYKSPSPGCSFTGFQIMF